MTKGVALRVLFTASLSLGLVRPSFPSASDSEAGPSVSGTVTGADGRPVAGARVDVVGGPAATSDAAGAFTIADVSPGRQTVRAARQGFGRAERTIDLEARGAQRVDLVLPFVPFSETVTVTATRSGRKLKDSPADLTVIAREDLARTPASALDEALKQVPSFSLFRRTSSLVSHPTTQGVSLRGVGASGASRSLVLVDGVPHNDAFGNWVYWDSVPQLAIESIEVAPSGLSSLYGSSAMAGVVDITTRRPEPRSVALQGFGASRGTADVQGLASHTAGKFGAAVGGALFTTEGYELVAEEDRGPVDVPSLSRHASGHWRLSFAPSSGLTLFQDGRVFAEDRENGTPLQTNETRETFLGLGLRAATSGGSVWQANVYARQNAFESTFSAVAPDRSSETLSLAQAVDYEDAGGNVSWTRAVGKSQVLSVGGDARFIEAEDREDVYIPPAINVRDRLIPARQLYAGAYLQDEVTFGARAVLTLGLRADYWRNFDASQTEIVNATQAVTLTPYADTSATRLTPRAGLLVRVNGGLALRGAAYGGFRAPSLNELYRPFRVGNVVTQQNPALGPERLWGGEVGLNHTPSPRLSWRGTAFWDDVGDPIANVTLSTTAGLITRQRQNLGRSRVRGLSFEGDMAPAPELRVQARYLFSDSRVVEFAASPEIEGNLLPQVPRHRASLRLDYSKPGALDVSLTGRYESVRFDDDQNRVSLDAFFVAGLSVASTFARSWTAFVSADNLFDSRYAVQGTPVESLGTPLTLSAGLRFELRPH